jgi:hypothetical protein
MNAGLKPLVSLIYQTPRQGEGQVKFTSTVTLTGCDGTLRLIESDTGRSFARVPMAMD